MKIRENFYNPWTKEIYQDSDDLTNVAYKTRSIEYRDAEYEVAATVLLPSNMSYRYYGNDEFIMGAETFIRETGTDSVMYYAFDVEDAAKENMDAFIADYKQNIRSDCDYESRESYEKQFQSLKNTFLIVGGILVFIVGLVGVLNFFNAILTGIYCAAVRWYDRKAVKDNVGNRRIILCIGFCSCVFDHEYCYRPIGWKGTGQYVLVLFLPIYYSTNIAGGTTVCLVGISAAADDISNNGEKVDCGTAAGNIKIFIFKNFYKKYVTNYFNSDKIISVVQTGRYILPKCIQFDAHRWEHI